MKVDIERILELNIGDIGRLNYMISMLQNGRTLYDSDRKYLEQLKIRHADLLAGEDAVRLSEEQPHSDHDASSDGDGAKGMQKDDAAERDPEANSNDDVHTQVAPHASTRNGRHGAVISAPGAMGKTRTAGFILSLIVLVMGYISGTFMLAIYLENPFAQDRVEILPFVAGAHALFLLGLVSALVLKK